MGVRALRLAVLVLALMIVGALSVAHAGDPTQPNDPGFNSCESQNPITGCKNDEQWNLFGQLTTPCPNGQPRPDDGLPCWAPLARDPQHAAGVDMTGAWAQGDLGRPDVLVAYIEGGVNYDSDNIKDGLEHNFLNKGELPLPEHMDGTTATTYDLNGDGRVNVPDYAEDPRVNPPCPADQQPGVIRAEGTTRSCVPGGQHQYLNSVHIGGKLTPYLSPEDLIVAFSNHSDSDHNGYVDDISGWNFDRNTNDPQTEDTSYGHAPGLISDIGGAADNNYEGVGQCRNCSVVPVKQGS